MTYNAPETSGNTEYTISADIWCFGVSLFELACGCLPSSIDSNFVATVRAGNSLKFPENPVLTPAFKDLVNKCITYDPAKRITAAQILEHPFTKGHEMAPVTPPKPHPVPAPAHVPAPPSPPPKPSGKKELPEHVLLKMVQTDFAQYMQYVIDMENKEKILKVEKKGSLDPYILSSAKPLSKGGFSEIYLCTHKATKKEYVMKLVKTDKMTDVKIANLLLGEIEIMLTLHKSAFTIQIEEYFVHKNNLCLILEYCNGGDLDNYVREVLRRTRKPLPLDELKLIAWNTACGLKDMHDLGMMHRDIKPKNILIIKDKQKDGRLIDIRLCDYGLSKKVESGNPLEGSTILGTFDYFAPELYDIMDKMMMGDTGKFTYTNKVDVWSYGILLYFAAYGKTPLEPPGSKQKVMKQKIINYPPCHDLPDSYINLIKKCLTYDPAARPDFQEVLKDPFFMKIEPKQKEELAPYEIIKEIGAGENGKSKIYEAKTEKDIFALKIISPPINVKYSNYEINAMLRLKNCRNIIKLRDYFMCKTDLCLVMDLYTGGNLQSHIIGMEKKGQPLPVDQQVWIAYCVLNGIKDVHAHNIIHRDIHPKNILVSLDPTNGRVTDVVLADLGVAKVVVDEIGMSTRIGSYQSPEMTLPDLGGKIDSKTDIWSYGMLLYFLIFGVHAENYPGNNTVRMLRKGEIKFNDKKASLSPDLVQLMWQCLKPIASQRLPAEELLKNKVFASCSK